MSLVNTTGEETLRLKHKQLNTVTCFSWKKKSDAVPSITFQLNQLKLFVVYIPEIERRSKNCITSYNDNKLQILFSVMAEIDRVTLGTSDALWSF